MDSGKASTLDFMDDHELSYGRSPLWEAGKPHVTIITIPVEVNKEENTLGVGHCGFFVVIVPEVPRLVYIVEHYPSATPWGAQGLFDIGLGGNRELQGLELTGIGQFAKFHHHAATGYEDGNCDKCDTQASRLVALQPVMITRLSTL